MLDHPRPEEIDTLVALAEATGVFTSEEVRIVREMLGAYFADPVQDDYYWQVYRERAEGPVLGFICYGPASMTDAVWEVYWIAVDPRVHKHGIGTILLDALEAELRAWNARAVYLETEDTARYAPARAFYEKRGYAPVAHLADFYAVGAGKIIYRK
jgi:GNAT superfamily N-acetyltransferase